MIVGIPTETSAGERRVAVTPEVTATLSGIGLEVVVEAGAGAEAGFPDDEYGARGAALVGRDEVFSRESALALYDALRAPKEITFFPGTHAVWRSPKQWYRRIEGFLREHLAG